MGWSRRIDEGQPLVYRLDGELNLILACRYHGR
jgi:Txe/YoeB family toxin of Txe-Axe toxin-antitoxin module